MWQSFRTYQTDLPEVLANIETEQHQKENWTFATKVSRETKVPEALERTYHDTVQFTSADHQRDIARAVIDHLSSRTPDVAPLDLSSLQDS